jgi:uroporphyrinogen decarboxylase
MAAPLLTGRVRPDCDALERLIRRQGTPRRVHAIELFLDAEVQDALIERFDLAAGVEPGDPFFAEKRHAALMEHLGYDTVRCKPDGLDFPLFRTKAADSAGLPRDGGRAFQDEHHGPVTSWEEFESYPWPDPRKVSLRSLEWYEKNLPDGMCISTGGVSHFCEYLTWLMGYETLCFALFENRPLVIAIRDKIISFYKEVMQAILTFPRVRLVWGSDDMGFRTGTLLSPGDLRELVFPGHTLMARMAHEKGRLYIMHSCGDLSAVMEDLVEAVGIDAKHSFEDTIQRVEDAKSLYGSRIAVLGGIDVDFLCRESEENVRGRTRRTLEACFPGGGWALGTGNSVANYVPLDNYLAMLDEGRRFLD